MSTTQWLNALHTGVIITLLAIIATFWFPLGGQIDRADWMWLLIVIIPIVTLRTALVKHLPKPLFLWGIIGAFFIAGILNLSLAPFGWGPIILARPLMGALIVYVLTESAVMRGDMERITQITIGFGIVLGILALLLTQWNEKSLPFQFLLDILPQPRNIPGFEGGFNANEIAGGLSFAVPFSAAIAIRRWRDNMPGYGATIAFGLLLTALMLGQSRTAATGIIIALALLIALLIPAGKWRRMAWVGWVLLVALQLFLIFNPVQRELLDDRDEFSFVARLYMWRSGLEILQDYPLTGVGMNAYRLRAVRELYPVEGYENRILPHIHNEVMQIGVDLGLPGILIFLALYGAAAYMIMTCWRRGDPSAQVISLGVGASLIAHGVFSLADATPLWDRLAFISWHMLGILAAQYILVQQAKAAQDNNFLS